MDAKLIISAHRKLSRKISLTELSRMGEAIDNEDVIVTSLGMFIIDDNEYPLSWNRKPERNIIGGGGSYSMVGSRIIGGQKYGQGVSGIIDKGNDFPKEVEDEINSWDTGVLFRHDPDRLTTRGLNQYDENEIRHFYYLTEKKRIEMKDLLENKQLLYSKCFHLICSFDRCYELIQEIKQYNSKAIFIYEPLPDACIPENYDQMAKVLPHVDIFTPNLNEGCKLVNMEEPGTMEEVEEIVDKYMAIGARICVLRCGPWGCFVGSNNVRQSLPAFHQDQANVKDVTGGGNSFCGGYIMGYYLTRDPIIGGIFGNIASGCIIEKLGLAKREGSKWNGKTTRERLEIYLAQNNLGKLIDVEKLDWVT